ncbi:putative bifunctional diguanylate cyclase/phosphodiesterase [Actinomycetospora termitidis]|uniref:Bifunctional diguanylate cyclase/phosphodiesterase n=1 Tax=Actinomycetospora termitidis TaxID=3053470 RepID=A0ABT7MGL6_9PSEU|nr:bifunctional diguanylate cyclase/phosphodiesterase [Actinomycetospora sp. Odt1-22]MDL5159314.1 bifunctional diguanylate cyclase/phosphodiesterase [Actinomycetospora sp. Odt1-22]
MESDPRPEPTDLDALVTAVATTLMGVDSTGLNEAAASVLATTVRALGLESGVLRFHDARRGVSVLVAEWPARPEIPDPDPVGVLPLDEDAAGAGLVVPLQTAGTTTGTLGFGGDRPWRDDEQRALTTIAVLFAQMQSRMAAEDRLRHIAHHDELTGLPNRRALMEHLSGILAAAEPGTRALLFIDVDRLKAMNDFLGHEAGDRFIVEIAQRLRSAVDPGDVVARLGGDEMVVAVDGTCDESRAVALAERVQRAIARPIQLGGQSLGRTVSVGIAVMEPAKVALAQWLRSADQAVLVAKSRGGNEVVVFTAEMETREQVRVAVEMNLLTAIRDGSLTIAYQPIVDLRTRAMVGVEALVRWHHPTLGPVAPELFVGVAEATNLAGELGDWVLAEAVRQFAAWRSELPPGALAGFAISVNISPVQLIAIDFVSTVAGVLERNGLSGDELILEVTEHAVVSDDAAALKTLHGLRELGVAIAIDDFGTGYSSLAQLKRFPVNTLKIDRGFVHDLGRNPDDFSIVRSIVKLAESFELDLIAEGVESEEAAATLVELGCRVAQGYLFSRPMTADALGTTLRGQNPGRYSRAQ